MKVLFQLGAACFLVLAACSPPAATTPETPIGSPDASRDAVLAVLTPVVAAEIGKDVTLEVTTANISNGWAYLVARPRNADGSAIDWRSTNLASRYENGAMDETGAVYALMRERNAAWVIVEYVIAPTDVAWEGWAAAHGVPAGVVDVPAAP